MFTCGETPNNKEKDPTFCLWSMFLPKPAGPRGYLILHPPLPCPLSPSPSPQWLAPLPESWASGRGWGAGMGPHC